MKSPKNRLHSVMIIGATPAGLAAANKLGELGIPVTLVDSDTDLNAKLADEKYKFESGVTFNFAYRPGLIRILRNTGIHCMLPAEIKSVRHSPQGFNVRVQPQATFIDPERCTLCGKCVAICPVGEGNGDLPIHISGRQALPGRVVIDKRREPLCQEGCPLGVNAQGYIALAKVGRFDEALALIRKNNVLPGICGRICTHPCESACRRGDVDAPLAIRDIKRYVADHGQVRHDNAEAQRKHQRPEQIAVIGSGPAGLAAAMDLVRQGFNVTIFEKEKEAGGFLRYGIGPHRLPRHILDRELKDIQSEGVVIKTNTPVDLADLQNFSRTYKAVIATTGSWGDRRLGAPGEDLNGVQGCVDFLTSVYRSEVESFRFRTAVIGDGNAALDLARTLKRLGADVTIVSWFAQYEIPADGEEVFAALEEGISIVDRRQVTAFVGESGIFKALQVQATCPGAPDANGIPWPELEPNGQVEKLEFEKAFVAIGQTGIYRESVGPDNLHANQRGYITTDEGCRTNLHNVYAAGDAVTGATTVVQAMAAGRRAAAQVILDLTTGKHVHRDSGDIRVARPQDRDFAPIDPDLASQGRTPMPEMPALRRVDNFGEVVLGYDDDQMRTEAGRCLQCGGCSQCLECLKACGENRAIKHDDLPAELVENAGVLIIADPDMVAGIKGEDVIRAYGPASAKSDVHAMILRGYAAAAKAMLLLKETTQRLRGQGMATVRPDPGLAESVRIGVFACRCNDSLGWSVEMTEYVAGLVDLPEVVYSETITSACNPEGVNAILAGVRDHGLTRIVLASCVCCPLNYVCSACTDQRSRLKEGLFTGTGISRSMVQTCNLRGEVLRLTHKDPVLALKKFKGLIDRSISVAGKLLPFPTPLRNYNFTTAVIGDSEAALDSALTLAEAGLEVLVFGTQKHPLARVPEHSNVFGFIGSQVSAVSGTLGEFKIDVLLDDVERTFNVGGVILGEKSRNIALYQRHNLLPNVTVQSTMQKIGVEGVPFMYPGTTSISGLFLADPPGVQISKHTKGAAAAVLAAAVMPRSPRQSRGFSVVIQEDLCRACGRCLKACPYQAIALHTKEDLTMVAVVDDSLCKGCGNCISVCPTNAADSPFRDHRYLEQTLEGLLME